MGMEEKPYMPLPGQQGADIRVQLTPEVPVPRVKPPRKRRRWGLYLIGLVFLALLAVGIYVSYVAISVAKISTEPFDLSGLSTDANGRTNILVLGVGDPGHAGEKLSDTLMVISFDTRNHKVAQVSIPRDLRVDVPGFGESKINAANAEGGVKLAEQTVSNTLNIPINYYVKTNFSGLKKIVDSVGGLDINVKERLYDPEYPCADDESKSCGIDIQPGQQHMDGAKVLEYVRCRKGTCGNDFGRAERQQEVLNLIRDKVVHIDLLWHPDRLNAIVAAVREGVETDMGSVQMAQSVREWSLGQKNQPVKLVLSTSDGGYLRDAAGSSDLIPIGGDFSAIQDKVKEIFTSPSPSPSP